jgi:hypothetical protein
VLLAWERAASTGRRSSKLGSSYRAEPVWSILRRAGPVAGTVALSSIRVRRPVRDGQELDVEGRLHAGDGLTHGPVTVDRRNIAGTEENGHESSSSCDITRQPRGWARYLRARAGGRGG